jgi:hypothetical protein
MPSSYSKHDLYELCVQSPTHLVPLLRAIHGADPRTLAEDFCGTAALSREWVKQIDGGRAIAVDADDDTIAVARASCPDAVQLIQGDVIDATEPRDHAADILFVGNFSIGYWHTRPDLIRYLKHVHARLASSPAPGGGSVTESSKVTEGVRERAGDAPTPSNLRPYDATQIHRRNTPGLFLCDTYAGESAFLTGHVHRNHPAEGGRVIRYTWEQRDADPLTGMVTNAIHFRVSRGGVIEQEIHDAFVYHWRLWSVPELRDCLLEAGFASTEVYAKVADAVDDQGNIYIHPADPADLDDSFIVLVAARTAD